MAVTDANLMLGRLLPDYFPKIFGKSEKEPLDIDASKVLFKQVAEEINASHEGHLTLDEIVYGYIPSIRSSYCWTEGLMKVNCA